MLRKWVGVAASVLALQSGAAMAQGALGANFNEHYEDVDYRELDRAGAKWIRLFLPMPQVDRGAAAHGAIRTTLEAGARGYKTIFTLTWPQKDRDFPKAGSAAFAREFARLDVIVPLVMGKVEHGRGSC